MVNEETVAKALELVAKGGGNYEHFFGKLTSPDWIEPLKKKERFSHPPPMIVEETSLRFPPWPEGEYLVRMAPLAPEAVFGAIDATAYESNNASVHNILLRIAAELPVGLAAQVAEKEAKWASQQGRFFHLYEDKVVSVVLKLAAEGRGDVALALLSPVLHVEAAPQREERPVIDAHMLRGSGTPLSRIDSWNIQRTLLRVSQTMVEATPEEFLALLSDSLNTAVEIYVNERGNGEDYSLIWRPRVDSDRFGDLTDTLVSAVRNAAVQIVRAGSYEIVVRVFRKYGWLIFRRLEYYTLSQADDLPPDFIDGVVSQDGLYDDQRANPEFNDFLAKIASGLPDKTRDRLLEMVDKGPDLSKYSKFLDAQGDKRQDAERWITDRWRLGWLTVLKSIAGEGRAKQLDELVIQYGPPRPAFEVGSVRAVAHISDVTLEELKKFSIPDLVGYLKKWAPPPRTHPEAPSRAGIGNELQAWVSEDPSLFADNLEAFQSLELHPTYLRSILDALISSLKTDRKFDPYKVAATIDWLLANTSKVGEEHFEWDEDPGWSWAHMSSARFLTELFLHESRLDVSRHMEFWSALKLIAENPSPAEKDEQEYRKRADFGMLALNSTRPVGLEAVMRYARWLKISHKELKVDAESTPEVFDLLAAHLDPEVDSSVAVREMYGMQFGLLCWLDQAWWEKQLPAMFPGDKTLRVLDRFAWNAYLRFSRAYAAMLPAMRFRYERAVGSLQSNDTDISEGDRRLGNHFMQYYASKALQIDDPLFTSFFAKASPALRAQTIGDVGWHLGQEDAGELDVGVQKRFMDVWEHRLAQGMQNVNAFREELGAFGWWFASKKFSDDWSIDQLMTVVEKFRNIHPDFAVIKRLAELAPKYPYEAVRCLGIIFEEDKDGWAIHGWADAPQVIIGEAIKGDEKSREEADRVANMLVARGHRSFKELLKMP
jgi:hypothetical protein